MYYSGLDKAIGQALLYDEIFLEGLFFEYSALLERTEILVRFRELAIGQL